MSKSKRYRVNERKASEYQPDPQNANRGNRRGQKMLETSYKNYGAGRSWLVDKDGHIVAGNHAREAAIAAGVEDVIEIELDDPTLQVVVRRSDIDLDDPENLTARQLAFADNVSGQVNLEWSPEEIREHQELLRQAELMRDDEIEALLTQADIEDDVDKATSKPQHNNRDALHGRQAKISPVLYVEDLAVFEDAILMARKLTGMRRRGDCLRYVCQFFIDGHTDEELKELLSEDN